MPKTIIFCADGTWNNAGTEGENHVEAQSNVFKLFDLLQGNISGTSVVKDPTGRISETEKILTVNGNITQIAKYINGVGNSKFKFNRALGGAFGFGLIERIARGYTFISRNYQAGDKIIIVGFSRGAYTARALAGLIANKGVLATQYQAGDQKSYDMAERAWYAYRASLADRNRSFLERVREAATAITNIRNFLQRFTIRDTDFTRDVPVLAVGVWDTVGSLGIPDFEFNDKRTEIRDVFGFADLDLSPRVQYGLHAVALDEQRLLFTPTLWNRRDGVKQTLFCGSHSDVGGGFAEADLSNIALRWMLDGLADTKIGVLFHHYQHITGSAGAVAHKKWEHLVNVTGRVRERPFKPAVAAGQIDVHASVAERRAKGPLTQYLGDKHPTAYQPQNY